MNAIGAIIAITGVGLVGFGAVSTLFGHLRQDKMTAGVIKLAGVVAIEIGVRRL